MWEKLQSLFTSPKNRQLTIDSHGQEACNLPYAQIREVMEWLGLSLIAADYKAKAHIIWDSPNSSMELDKVLRSGQRRGEPIFLYRCGDRPMSPPMGCYWRLMPEYPTLRIYQLEQKEA